MRDYGIHVHGEYLPVADNGLVRGRITVPTAVAEIVSIITDKFFAEKELEAFSAETIDTCPVPEVFKDIDWVPAEALAHMGLRVTDEQHLVYTSSVSPHEDHVFGLTLMWVLKADPGLAFRTKDGPWIWHEVGDWFVFDDRVEHEVECGVKKHASDPDLEWKAMYCAWCIKLEVL